ncbi:Hypothetical protein SMAX5B_014617 [Scophthalmus maximus]|uniref:Uncharacterized protein n=1 Tax=Scophthalmus maximus TaxID=52904 RepID=A0A2U9BZM7_SCOMX|nr:Hypothetical protein SMAX5B_014617 [Scophthalmus maximus]
MAASHHARRWPNRQEQPVFSVMLKDTFTCGQKELGFKLPVLRLKESSTVQASINPKKVHKSLPAGNKCLALGL